MENSNIKHKSITFTGIYNKDNFYHKEVKLSIFCILYKEAKHIKSNKLKQEYQHKSFLQMYRAGQKFLTFNDMDFL